MDAKLMMPKQPFDEPRLRAVRTWKSDGARNIMDLEIAVKNLLYNEPDYREEGEEAVRDCLLAGCEMETPLARFRVWTGNSDENMLAAIDD